MTSKKLLNKISFIQSKLQKYVITIKDYIKTTKAHKKLVNNGKETIIINEEQINEGIHTNFNLNSCSKEKVVDIGNNNNILQVYNYDTST